MLPGPGYAAADFSRLTGIRPDVLRKYRERGVFTPSSADARGRRRYGADQLAPGRLLAALVGSGMPVGRAAAVVANQDRGAVQEHLVVVQGLLSRAREHLPVRGGAWPPGRLAEERGCWSVTGTPVGLDEALGRGAPGALVDRGGVLDDLVGSASRRGWGVPGPVRLLLSADLCSASPLVRLL